MQCPAGNEYCQTIQCNYWALRGWCLLSCTSRAIDEEKEALRLKIITIEKELIEARETIIKSVVVVDGLNTDIEKLNQKLSDAQLTIKNYRKPCVN